MLRRMELDRVLWKMTFLASHQVRRNRWEQMGICHHFFHRSKSKLGEQITPNTKACPHLVWKCSARSGHLYVPPWLTWLALASVAASVLRVLKYSQPGQAKLPRSAFLAQNVAECRISQANCSRSLCQLNYMHFRVVAVWLGYWPFLIQILTKFVPDLALFKVDSRRNHARLLALFSGCAVSPVPDR